jgi:hypothetical protein
VFYPSPTFAVEDGRVVEHLKCLLTDPESQKD